MGDIERVAHTLLADNNAGEFPTPLTRSGHRAPWDARKPDRQLGQRRNLAPALPATCRGCGAGLPNRRLRYCNPCRDQQLAERGPKARAAAADLLARLRAEQRDPAHGGRAAELRGTKNAAHQRAACDWTGDLLDPAVFRSEILPGGRLQHLLVPSALACGWRWSSCVL